MAEQYFSSKSALEPLLAPGKLLNLTRLDRGVQIEFEQAELLIEFLTPDLVQIDWFPSLAPVSYAIVEQDWQTRQLRRQTLRVGKGFYSLKC